MAAINSFLIYAVAYRFAAPESAWVSVVGTRATFIMDHLRKTRHYGPVTYVVWIAALIAIGTLTGASLWPH